MASASGACEFRATLEETVCRRLFFVPIGPNHANLLSISPFSPARLTIPQKWKGQNPVAH
jgi:hypothetical protein